MPRAVAPAPADLVVDDHDLLRPGAARALVHTHGGGAPVWEAATLVDGLALYGREAGRIGWVLLDLALPASHGLDGLAEFLGRFPAARIAVLSAQMDAALADEAIAHAAAACFAKSGDIGALARCLFPEQVVAQATGAGAHAANSVAEPRADAVPEPRTDIYESLAQATDDSTLLAQFSSQGARGFRMLSPVAFGGDGAQSTQWLYIKDGSQAATFEYVSFPEGARDGFLAEANAQGAAGFGLIGSLVAGRAPRTYYFKPANCTGPLCDTRSPFGG